MPNNINFNKLVELLLPIALRQKIILAFKKAFIAPLNALNDLFDLFRSDKDRQISYNSQVCYLRKLLNDKFDFSERRITIEQAEKKMPLPIYRREELKPVKIGRVILYRRDIIEYDNEFIVYVPSGLQSRQEEIVANLNYYKLATRIYRIKYI